MDLIINIPQTKIGISKLSLILILFLLTHSLSNWNVFADMLDDKDLKRFKDIGLARHEFLDAMLALSRMRYPDSEVTISTSFPFPSLDAVVKCSQY